MKKRHNPDKIQNNYGGDYDCPNYDTYSSGEEFCHQESGKKDGWREWIMWDKKTNKKLSCKGNRHNCKKLYYAWLASKNNN
jgi:hypothetical protein